MLVFVLCCKTMGQERKLEENLDMNEFMLKLAARR